MLKTLKWPENQTPAAKILTWVLATPKDEQNTAFIEIGQKIAVENPEIFLKFLGDFQKKSEKFPGNTQDSAVTSSTASEWHRAQAMQIAYNIKHKNLINAIKQFRAWTGCTLKEAKDCIDRIRDSKATCAASATYWSNIKLVLEYM